MDTTTTNPNNTSWLTVPEAAEELRIPCTR